MSNLQEFKRSNPLLPEDMGSCSEYLEKIEVTNDSRIKKLYPKENLIQAYTKISDGELLFSREVFNTLLPPKVYQTIKYLDFHYDEDYGISLAFSNDTKCYMIPEERFSLVNTYWKKYWKVSQPSFSCELPLAEFNDYLTAVDRKFIYMKLNLEESGPTGVDLIYLYPKKVVKHTQYPLFLSELGIIRNN